MLWTSFNSSSFQKEMSFTLRPKTGEIRLDLHYGRIPKGWYWHTVLCSHCCREIQANNTVCSEHNTLIENFESRVCWSTVSYVNKMLCRCRGTARRVLSITTTKVTFRLTQGHWYSSHSIGHTRFHISLSLHLCFYLAPFLRYYYLFPKISTRGHMTRPRQLRGRLSFQDYQLNAAIHAYKIWRL